MACCIYPVLNYPKDGHMFPDVFAQAISAVEPFALTYYNTIFDFLHANGLGWVLTAASPTGESQNACFDGRHMTCLMK